MKACKADDNFFGFKDFGESIEGVGGTLLTSCPRGIVRGPKAIFDGDCFKCVSKDAEFYPCLFARPKPKSRVRFYLISKGYDHSRLLALAKFGKKKGLRFVNNAFLFEELSANGAEELKPRISEMVSRFASVIESVLQDHSKGVLA